MFDIKHKFYDLTYTFLEPFPILVLAPMYLICRCTSVRMNCKIMSYVSQNNAIKNIFDVYLMGNEKSVTSNPIISKPSTSLPPRTIIFSPTDTDAARNRPV